MLLVVKALFLAYLGNYSIFTEIFIVSILPFENYGFGLGFNF